MLGIYPDPGSQLACHAGLPQLPRYFEQPVPYPAFEYGATDVIRTDRDGHVQAPKGPGLGIGIDWPAIKKSTILHFEVRR